MKVNKPPVEPITTQAQDLPPQENFKGQQEENRQEEKIMEINLKKNFGGWKRAGSPRNKGCWSYS